MATSALKTVQNDLKSAEHEQIVKLTSPVLQIYRHFYSVFSSLVEVGSFLLKDIFFPPNFGAEIVFSLCMTLWSPSGKDIVVDIASFSALEKIENIGIYIHIYVIDRARLAALYLYICSDHVTS